MGPRLRGGDAKVLRYAFPIAETSADPARVSDVYSNTVISAIFDTPLDYDYLARPMKLKPLTLAAMPEVSEDGTTYTLRVKPGIHFADDPAFNGKKRELTAEDYVYSLKRIMDPRIASPLLGELEGKIVGGDEAIARARKANRFDYDTPIEGLKALDRYTLRVKLTEPSFIFLYNFADCRLACAVAREVVEKYGDDIGSHPVGTGPYRMAFWKRSSKMVFERNPNFREEVWDAEPLAGDARGQEMLRKLKGRRLPLIDRVEIYVVEETQPRWLAFLNGEFDLMFQLPEEYANQAIPNNELAPNLRKRGIAHGADHGARPHLQLLQHGGSGGGRLHAGEGRAAARDLARLQDPRRDRHPAQGAGDPRRRRPTARAWPATIRSFRTSANEYNVPKAKALLDMFGYVDRDGDGYREMPDGSRARDQGQLHAHGAATSSWTSCGSAAWTTSASASPSARRSGPTC